MNLKYLTPEAYAQLKKDILLNKEKYISGSSDWLGDYFKNKGLEEYYKTSSITVPRVTLECNGTNDEAINADDKQNTKALYSAYKESITPLQATDYLLWTAVTHFEYAEYVMKRWEKKDDNIDVAKRFFATKARSSLCYYHAIARFWWSGYLTYEDEKASTYPWELTDVLFSAQQIQKDLFDQPFSMNKDTVKGLLKALKIIQEERGNNATTVFRDCCNSYLNHYGAVTVLEFLSADDIQDIAYKYMHNHK